MGLQWTGNVVRIRKKKNAHKILVSKPLGKYPFANRHENNIKNSSHGSNLQGTGSGSSPITSLGIGGVESPGSATRFIFSVHHTLLDFALHSSLMELNPS